MPASALATSANFPREAPLAQSSQYESVRPARTETGGVNNRCQFQQRRHAEHCVCIASVVHCMPEICQRLRRRRRRRVAAAARKMSRQKPIHCCTHTHIRTHTPVHMRAASNAQVPRRPTTIAPADRVCGSRHTRLASSSPPPRSRWSSSSSSLACNINWYFKQIGFNTTSTTTRARCPHTVIICLSSE